MARNGDRSVVLHISTTIGAPAEGRMRHTVDLATTHFGSTAKGQVQIFVPMYMMQCPGVYGQCAVSAPTEGGSLLSSADPYLRAG